ncbi:MAG: hypothetical protein C4570_06090 [Ammonifex sp.]|jgi:hypothetical protein|nr:MAG: hypothetical protein C4570_06090 [Ammonifex sp.]
MADLRARVAYVKGLLSGFGTDDGNRGERFSEEMVKVIHEFAEEIEDLKSAQEGLEEYVQALDEDLYAVETMVFGEDGEELVDDAGATGLDAGEFTLDDLDNDTGNGTRVNDDAF